MIDKDKRAYYTASVHFSLETMRQVKELEESLGESRSKIISRAIQILYGCPRVTIHKPFLTSQED